MKIIILTLALILVCSIAYAVSIQFCSGADLGCEVTFETLTNHHFIIARDFHPGATFSLQFLNKTKGLIYGSGVDYQLSRSFDADLGSMTDA